MTLDEAARFLADAGVENARSEARLLLALALGVPREATLSGALTPTPEQQAAFETFTARRAAREPFAYIAGRKEFWSRDFKVGPGVLIPRPETEILIEQALRHMGPDAALSIADLGTGSGAILLAALDAFPKAKGLGLEQSSQAFAYAAANAAGSRAVMRQANWHNAPDRAFDLVFCNPPYIPSADIAGLEPEVRGHEPHAALDGGPDGLDAYRALSGLLPRLLRPGGLAVLEIGIGQGPALKTIFGNLEWVDLAPDLAGIPRALVLKTAN